ncbi:signal recognition particle-docking protein FtsY [Paucilactobacillus suebicus]|uniref:Signal recognition particle receptor FtsY n=1 Tax=Paucilactobacillus suebicus DSM 5007 = KCTC 3549 TaxID=1423807 RepID=A0A0R1W5M8_9LACO|nr:signal recognition particle-docking protein FtsY [Paucilactobacillus suebicus]KRM13144.1 signal recognition particle-docking protein FtsY [Paucilactobacillus suebicus DSM 5007 = KCTC 3549]
MGLFDIFKRKSRKTDEQSEQKEENSSAAEIKSESAVQPTTGEDRTAAEAVPDNTSSNSKTIEPGKEESIESENSTEDVETTETAESSASSIEEPVPDELQQEDTVEQSESSESNADNDSETSDSPIQDEEEKQDSKYEKGLEKTRTGFGARLNALLANFRHVDEEFFENLEEALIESDVGFEMAVSISDQLREEVKLQNAKSKQDVTNVIIEKMVDLYEQQGKDEHTEINFAKSGPTIILFVGVNGVGKTTTIGKMAAMYQKQGKKVLLAAADTFRAGAIQQLQVWGKRDNVPVVAGPEKSDPAAVVFDAVSKAKKENYDVLFVDTAGRLQNKVNLMNELEKMKRIISREIPDAPHEVLLVLDSTTGQNALSQAKLFKESTDVTGIVLTKLDGTARGGIVLAIRNELHLPVKYVGLGEQVDDLQAFDASEFVYGLFKGLVEPTK